jgi:hypothetical protein
MALSRPERHIALSEKQYVLGRKDSTGGGVLNIGRYYALDGSLGAPVYLDALRPHVIFICGKRGYGKSYTIGVFLEEIASLKEEVKQNLGVVVVDTLGIFWTTQFPSKENTEHILECGRKPKGFIIRLFVPEHAVDHYSKNGMCVERFSLGVGQLSPMHWTQLFNMKATDAVGIALTRAVLTMQQVSDCYSLEDILTFIQQDVRADNETKNAVENFFLMAKSWGIFDKQGLSMTDLVRRGTVTVLDLSALQSPVLKDIVVSLVSEKIFEERVKERKIHEQKKIGFDVEEKGIPLVWLAVDEAQLFVPYEKKTLSKEVLIEEWMRQGRQPGLSLIMATQRPSAVEPEVLSHSDIIICHRLTAQEDIDALSRIRPTYMHGDIAESIKKIGSEKGVALLVDDTSEAVHIIKVRPRLSWHGGAEPVINDV